MPLIEVVRNQEAMKSQQIHSKEYFRLYRIPSNISKRPKLFSLHNHSFLSARKGKNI